MSTETVAKLRAANDQMKFLINLCTTAQIIAERTGQPMSEQNKDSIRYHLKILKEKVDALVC